MLLFPQEEKKLILSNAEKKKLLHREQKKISSRLAKYAALSMTPNLLGSVLVKAPQADVQKVCQRGSAAELLN